MQYYYILTPTQIHSVVITVQYNSTEMLNYCRVTKIQLPDITDIKKYVLTKVQNYCP